MTQALRHPHPYGRANLPGPITGSYVTFCLGPFSLAANLSTGQRFLGIYVPFDFRLEAVSWSHGAATGGGTLTTAVYNHGSLLQVSGATVVAVSFSFAALSGAIGGASMSTVQDARDIASGSYLFLDPLTQATTGTSTDTVFVFMGYALDHVNADPAND